MEADADGAPPPRPDHVRQNRPDRKPRLIGGGKPKAEGRKPEADKQEAGRPEARKPDARKKDAGEKGKGWAKAKPTSTKPWGKSKSPMAGKPSKKQRKG
jgi:hypothetical protein